jgi:hypothetical protein
MIIILACTCLIRKCIQFYRIFPRIYQSVQMLFTAFSRATGESRECSLDWPCDTIKSISRILHGSEDISILIRWLTREAVLKNSILPDLGNDRIVKSLPFLLHVMEDNVMSLSRQSHVTCDWRQLIQCLLIQGMGKRAQISPIMKIEITIVFEKTADSRTDGL